MVRTKMILLKMVRTRGERKRQFSKTQNATPKLNANNAMRSPLVRTHITQQGWNTVYEYYSIPNSPPKLYSLTIKVIPAIFCEILCTSTIVAIFSQKKESAVTLKCKNKNKKKIIATITIKNCKFEEEEAQALNSVQGK